jgi:hypothetical protein
MGKDGIKFRRYCSPTKIFGTYMLAMCLTSGEIRRFAFTGLSGITLKDANEVSIPMPMTPIT